MYIKLTSPAYKNASNAKPPNVKMSDYLSGILEKILSDGSVFFIFNPAPAEERLPALQYFANSIIEMKEFYGFKFLTKEEYDAAQAASIELAAKERLASEQKILEFPSNG